MDKTTVYLPRETKRALSRMAKDQGRSEAELIRAAVGKLVAEGDRPRPTLPLFRGDDPTLAEHVDEALAGFGS